MLNVDFAFEINSEPRFHRYSKIFFDIGFNPQYSDYK